MIIGVRARESKQESETIQDKLLVTWLLIKQKLAEFTYMVVTDMIGGNVRRRIPIIRHCCCLKVVVVLLMGLMI